MNMNLSLHDSEPNFPAVSRQIRLAMDPFHSTVDSKAQLGITVQALLSVKGVALKDLSWTYLY